MKNDRIGKSDGRNRHAKTQRADGVLRRVYRGLFFVVDVEED